jgi:hypothetical protein
LSSLHKNMERCAVRDFTFCCVVGGCGLRERLLLSRKRNAHFSIKAFV